MESLLNYLNQLCDNTLTHDEYETVGRKIAAYQLNNPSTKTVSRERTDRIENAILALWSHNEILTRETVEECRRVLTGEVSPETASLPTPSFRDFSKSRDARPTDELDEVLDELFEIIDAAAQQTAEPANREERIAEAEAIWQNFLNGDPLTTDDLRLFQSTGLL